MQPFSEQGNPLCTNCILHETAKTICVMGNGNIEKRIMVIGEAPGATEDEKGEPFQGRAGALLDEALEAGGLPRSEVYVTNLVKCRPPGNRRPTVEEMTACIDYLVREYKALDPIGVLLLGNTAAQALLSTEQGISKIRGQISALVHPFRFSVKVYATYHPAAALRSRSTKETFMADVAAFAKLALGEYRKTLSSPPLKDTHV